MAADANKLDPHCSYGGVSADTRCFSSTGGGCRLRRRSRAMVLVAMPLNVANSVPFPDRGDVSSGKAGAETYASYHRHHDWNLRVSYVGQRLSCRGPILSLMFGDYYRDGAPILALLSGSRSGRKRFG